MFPWKLDLESSDEPKDMQHELIWVWYAASIENWMKIFKLARRILGLVPWNNFEVSQNKCILLEITVLWNCLCGPRRGNSNISLVIVLYCYHINEYIKGVLFCFSLTKKIHNWEVSLKLHGEETKELSHRSFTYPKIEQACSMICHRDVKLSLHKTII